MEQEGMQVVGKCFGSTVVGPRGQIVIPVEARRELGMDVGTRLLTFKLFQGRGLVFVKVEAVEELVNIMSQHVNVFTKLVREIRTENLENEADRD
jgi:bifunctional DNA-binding transcriptional regulator/antitoxin component of YhaV-PrlF toxin-antitoxin module